MWDVSMQDDEGGDDEQQCSLIQRYYSWADYGLGAEAWTVCTYKFPHHTLQIDTIKIVQYSKL